MNYEQAKEMALSLNSSFNACHEYKIAYHFFEKTDVDVDGESGAVILKQSGKAINFISFILDYHPEKNPVEIEF